MLINDIKDRYNERKANGYKMGKRSLNNMSHDELVEAAGLVAKQTNRQLKNMLLKHDIQSPAVSQYIQANTMGQDITDISDPKELYEAGRIKVSKNMSDDELKAKIETSMNFYESKTHTKKGAEQWEKKIEKTLKENTGLDMANEKREDKREFWKILEELKKAKGVMASRWASNSDEVLAEVNDLITNQNLTLKQAINKLTLEATNLGVDDYARNKIQSKIAGAQNLGSDENFS